MDAQDLFLVIGEQQVTIRVLTDRLEQMAKELEAKNERLAELNGEVDEEKIAYDREHEKTKEGGDEQPTPLRD